MIKILNTEDSPTQVQEPRNFPKSNIQSPSVLTGGYVSKKVHSWVVSIKFPLHETRKEEDFVSLWDWRTSTVYRERIEGTYECAAPFGTRA